ncbi:MAG: hypothetical protein ABR903_08235 [Thermodesulfovibrionales bacterium]|jgi:hypothetical protein
MAHINHKRGKERSKYGMFANPGIEITKNHLTSTNSTHIPLLDRKDFIPDCWSYQEIFPEVNRLHAPVIASHPHYLSESDRNLFLWNNREHYTKYIDAGEIVNRDDLFNVISMKKIPYIANGDFHRTRLLDSWKTLLRCEKGCRIPDEGYTVNKGVAITF